MAGCAPLSPTKASLLARESAWLASGSGVRRFPCQRQPAKEHKVPLRSPQGHADKVCLQCVVTRRVRYRERGRCACANVQLRRTARTRGEHLNCALAPGLQFDTLELRNPPAAAWLESHRFHVQVVRSIVRFEGGYEQLHFWRGQEVEFGLILSQKYWFCEALEI